MRFDETTVADAGNNAQMKIEAVNESEVAEGLMIWSSTQIAAPSQVLMVPLAFQSSHRGRE